MLNHFWLPGMLHWIVLSSFIAILLMHLQIILVKKYIHTDWQITKRYRTLCLLTSFDQGKITCVIWFGQPPEAKMLHTQSLSAATSHHVHYFVSYSFIQVSYLRFLPLCRCSISAFNQSIYVKLTWKYVQDSDDCLRFRGGQQKGVKIN